MVYFTALKLPNTKEWIHEKSYIHSMIYSSMYVGYAKNNGLTHETKSVLQKIVKNV